VRAVAAVPSLRHPRDRDLLRGRHARWRPRVTDGARGHALRAVRGDDVRDQAAGPMTATGDRASSGDPAESPQLALPLTDAPHVAILTGLSGGGKTAAAKLFEDLEYTVVDNLPGELLAQLADLVSTDPGRFSRVAIVVDVRAGDAETAYRAMRG